MAQIVASIAVLVTLLGLATVRFGTNSLQVPQMLPSTVVNVGSTHLTVSDLILLGLALACCCGVAAYFRWTNFGVATRASATNEDEIGLMGYNPHLLDSGAWAIASIISTVLLILASPATSVNTSVAYLVVPALAVLLVARMKSLRMIAIASVVLGVAQSLLTLGTSYTWWPTWADSGIQDALPFLVAIIVLYTFGDRLNTRNESLGGGLPRVRLPKRPAVTVAAIVVVSAVALLATSGPIRFGVITSLAMAVIILSYTVVTGYLGQVSLAQIAFAGAGGFMLSKLATNWGIGFPLNLILAGLFATVIGVIIGVAALRFQGTKLAIVTLAAAVAIQAFVFENASFTPTSGNPVPAPRIFGLNLAVESGQDVARISFGLLALVILALSVMVLLRWANGRTGRAWLAVRSNERAAASAGIRVSATKIIAFGISAFLAGVAGCLIGFSQGQLSAASFEVDTGILIFATAFLGGITSVGGAMVGGAIAPLGVVYVFLNDRISFGNYYELIAGLGLIVTVLFNPDGIAGKIGSQFAGLSLPSGWTARQATTESDQGPSVSLSPAKDTDITIVSDSKGGLR
jgi:branched-chain amino acid transport system permease protein